MKPKLLQLAIDNRATPKSFEVKADASGDAEIYLYDVIDSYYGVSATAFAAALAEITSNKIHLHINSPGGDVFEARAMVAAIGASKATIVAHIDGLAASAASYVAMACDEVQITDGAFFMIHNAWSFAMGNAADMRATADLLDKIDMSIVSDYMRKTGKDEAQIKDWMAAETWFSAQEAVDLGFADVMVSNEKGKAKNAWNLAAYKNAPVIQPDPEPDYSSETRARMLALLTRI
jgi:ATP-dependent Clp protease protease subunit